MADWLPLAGVCTGIRRPDGGRLLAILIPAQCQRHARHRSSTPQGMVTASLRRRVPPSIRSANAAVAASDRRQNRGGTGYCDAGTYDNICEIARFLANVFTHCAFEPEPLGGGSGRVVIQAVASMHNHATAGAAATADSGRCSAVQRLAVRVTTRRHTLDASFATRASLAPAERRSYEQPLSRWTRALSGSDSAGWSIQGAGIDGRRGVATTPLLAHLFADYGSAAGR